MLSTAFARPETGISRRKRDSRGAGQRVRVPDSFVIATVLRPSCNSQLAPAVTIPSKPWFKYDLLPQERLCAHLGGGCRRFASHPCCRAERADTPRGRS